jgi:hypothetical protein
MHHPMPLRERATESRRTAAFRRMGLVGLLDALEVSVAVGATGLTGLVHRLACRA